MRVKAILTSAMASLAIASPAAADPAQPFSYSDCYYSDYGTYCYTVKGVTQVTETPKGSKFTSNYEIENQFTGLGSAVGCSYYGSSKVHHSQHIKRGQEVIRFRDRGAFGTACNGSNYDCSYVTRYAAAKGVVSRESTDFGCVTRDTD